MATVTVYTASRMASIEASSIISGSIVGDDLMLTNYGGSTFNAGNVRGLIGPQGDPGLTITELAGSIDLNTLITSGYYMQSQSAEAASGTNYPVPVAGFLSVYGPSGGTFIFQDYTTYNGSSYVGQTFRRSYYSGTWGPWKYIGGGVTPFTSRYKSATQTLTTATNYTIDFDGSDALEGGMTESAGVITLPFDGKYQVNSSVHIQSTATVGTMTLIILKTGAVWRQMNRKFDGANESHDISALIKCVAGDTIAIRVSQTSGANATLYGVAPGVRYTSLDICLVGS